MLQLLLWLITLFFPWLPMPQPSGEEPPLAAPTIVPGQCRAGVIVAVINEPWHTRTEVQTKPDGTLHAVTVADPRCWQVRICAGYDDPAWYCVPRDEWLKLRTGDWWDSRRK